MQSSIFNAIHNLALQIFMYANAVKRKCKTFNVCLLLTANCLMLAACSKILLTAYSLH